MNEEQQASVNELRELARAIVAFIEQDSKSFRRQQALMSGANGALYNAQEAFGDEG